MTTCILLEDSSNLNHSTSRLVIEDDTSGYSDTLELPQTELDTLQGFQKSYQNCPKHEPQQTALKRLGYAVYQWLDQQGSLSDILKAQPEAPWVVEFQLKTQPQTAWQQAFIHVPWECLADEHEFLAGKRGLNYSPLRRIGTATQVKVASDYRLSVMFMAASPEGVNSLAYEDEEAAILDAVGGIYQHQLDLHVEESGNRHQLAQELQRIQGCDVLHLSCHGQNSASPTLILEDCYGQQEASNAQQLHQAIRPPVNALGLPQCGC